MAEFNEYSNIKLHENDLRNVVEFYCKSIQRQINTTTDKDIQTIYERKLMRYRQALMTINQLELLPAQHQKTK